VSAYLTRKDLSVLMGIVPDRVGTLDREGRLPCKSVRMTIVDSEGVDRRIVAYPKAIMLPWIANGGHRAEYLGRKKKVKVKVEGITFRRVFAGEFFTDEEKQEAGFRMANAKISKPKTTTVSMIGDWNKGERLKHRS
jgi:hypothetical protein